jgi:hypothetical protein
MKTLADVEVQHGVKDADDYRLALKLASEWIAAFRDRVSVDLVRLV